MSTSHEVRPVEDLDPKALAAFAAEAAIEAVELYIEVADELVDIYAAGELAADYEIRLAQMRRIGRGAGLNLAVTCRLIDEVTLRHGATIAPADDARRVQAVLRMVGESMVALASVASLEDLGSLPLVDPEMLRRMLGHAAVSAWLEGQGIDSGHIGEISAAA